MGKPKRLYPMGCFPQITRASTNKYKPYLTELEYTWKRTATTHHSSHISGYRYPEIVVAIR